MNEIKKKSTFHILNLVAKSQVKFQLKNFQAHNQSPVVSKSHIKAKKLKKTISHNL